MNIITTIKKTIKVYIEIRKIIHLLNVQFVIKIIALLAICLNLHFINNTFAQSYFVNEGHLVNTNNLVLEGNFKNLGTFVNNSSDFIFKGSAPQTIVSGSSSYYNIIFNNTGENNADIILEDDIRLMGNAEFTNGIVNTGENEFIFLEGSSTDIGNANSFIDGKARKTGSTLFTFPTGHVNNRDIGDGSQDYIIWAPIRVNPAGNTDVTVRYFYDNEYLPTWWYHDWTHETPLTHTTDREYWLVESGENLDITLFWRNNIDCVIHDFCEQGTTNFLPDYLTVAYWDNIWKDAEGTVSGDYENGEIQAFLSIPFESKTERFITFAGKNADIPLPIELYSFKVKCNNNSAIIKWVTASEINNDYFILEKSKDAVNFIEIARIPGAGFSNEFIEYEFEYLNASDEYAYYRLTQVDFDGQSETFKTYFADCYYDEKAKIVVYPNPFHSEINLLMENFKDNIIWFEIYDELGKLILKEKYNGNGSIMSHTIQLDYLVPGVYNLRTISKRHLFVNKIVKQ